MHRTLSIAAFFAALGWAHASWAQTAGANRCTVSVTPVQFGTYNASRPADVRTTGIVTYTCTLSQPISVGVTRGGAAHAAGRTMGHAGSMLSYNLYLDAAGTIVWGDGAGGTQLYRDPAPPPNTPVSFPVYGRLPPQQREARVGVHDDTLIVTITY